MKISTTVSRINFYGSVWLFLLASMFSFCYLLESGTGERQLILVIFLFFLLATITTWLLSLNEKSVPISNIGFVLIIITILYSVYPLFSFWMTDFEWTLISDNRLLSYKVKPAELATLSVFHLSYIIALMVGFFLVTWPRLKSPNLRNYITIKSSHIYAVFIIYLSIEGFYLLVDYGNLSSIYVVKQFLHNLSKIQLALIIAFFFIVLNNWQNIFYRNALWIYLLYELSLVLLQLSGRTYLFILFIAFLMTYYIHKRLTFKFGILIFIIMLIFFIFWGYVRTNMYSSIGEFSFWSGSNEFTSIFGNAYDLFRRKELGVLPEIPFSVIYNDILLLIPSQMLSFEKWSTSQWYLEVIGLRGKGVGFAFGVISQGVIGGGVVELLIRGILTGLFFGLFHNWYKNNYYSLWPNVIYVFIAVRSYQIYRAGTGYIIYDIFYVVIPVILAVFLVAQLIPKKQQQS